MAAAADDQRPPGDDPAAARDLDAPTGDEPALNAPAGRDDEDPGRSLWRGLISLAILVALVASLLLAIPGLHGVADDVAEMQVGWIVVAVALEILSCLGYVVAFLALPALSDRLAHRSGPGRVRTLMVEFAGTIRSTRHLLSTPDWRLIGAVAFLWCDIGVLAACFAAAGHEPPLATLVLAYQIGYLSNLIPIPGNIGVLDGSLVGMFVLYGVSGTLSAAATVVYHAIALWIPAMWGTGAFIILRRTRHEPITLRPPREVRRQRRLERRKHAVK
jgi:uncharacterized membrane protein YbhN (UPF0104 family)